MSLSCVFGLAACLNFGGHAYTAQEAVDILDQCDMLRTLPVASFVMHPARPNDTVRSRVRRSWGVLTGEELDKAGLDLEWPKHPGARKAAWLHTCRQFEAAYYRDSSWSK